MAAPPRMWRNYLPNWARAHARGAIEALPAGVQRYLPAHDLRRSIRAHPEDRDALDPGWRERAGHGAPTPQEITARSQFIELEGALARAGNVWQGPRMQALRENQRKQLAGAYFDSLIEGREVFVNLYTSIFADDLADELLRQKMGERMDAVLHGTDLTPLFPANVNFGPFADEEDHAVYGVRAARGILDAWEGRPLPYNLPADLFPLVGRIHEEENRLPAPAVAGMPVFDDALYNGLPAPQPERNITGDDPINFEPFTNGQQLLIVRVNDHDFVFKRSSLENWLNARRTEGEAWTNPATGLPITIANLQRATARVRAHGGQRRTRRSNPLGHRPSTRRRRAGRGAHR